MNAISQNVFQFNQSANVRTFADEKGEYWFLANDVCAILGYANARKAISDHCRDKGVTKRYTPTQSGEQEMTYINEPNLYRLIIKSRKPEAEAFEEWVMEEVLPTIRQTGSYQLSGSHQAAYLNEWEAEHIRAAVKARSRRTGETTQAVYAKLHAFMETDSYLRICRADFQSALNFLASMENAPDLFGQHKTVLDDRAMQHIKALVNYLPYMIEFYHIVEPAVRCLNRNLTYHAHDRFTHAHIAIRGLARSLNMPIMEYHEAHAVLTG